MPAALAERLGITDSAISKWENGRCLPDASLMLPLCGLFGIDVNELLRGERLETEDNYKEMAEKNLLARKEQEEQYNRRLPALEWVIGITGTVAFMLLLFAACFAVEDMAWRVVLIVAAAAFLLVGGWFALKQEQGVGYCGCPRCGERHFQKKVLTKQTRPNENDGAHPAVVLPCD